MRREVGPLLLARHFVRELELVGDGRPRAAAASARQQLSVGEAGGGADRQPPVLALAALRRRRVGVGGGDLHELLGIPPALLNDDRLGRALELFAVYAETLRGALAARAIERFGVDAGRLHVDLTALRVDGRLRGLGAGRARAGPRGRASRARSGRCRPASADGVSLYLRPDPGNAAELTLIGAALERLRELLRAGAAVLIVCDSALRPAQDALRDRPRGPSLHRPAQGQHRLPGALPGRGRRRRRCARCATSRSASERCPPRSAPATAARPRDWEVTDPETGERHRFRVAYIHSSEEEREVAAARERALGKAEEKLGRVAGGLGGRHYKTRKQVERRVAQDHHRPRRGA